MNHLLCRGRAVGTEPAQGAVHAALYCSADPGLSVAPGDLVELGLSVAPAGDAPRGCAYLLEESLVESADILGVEGLEYFPVQRWFRARADLGTHASGIVSLRVKEPSGPPRLRPQIKVAVPDGSGQKLIRTGPLSDTSLPVRAATAPGLRIVVRPGDLGAVNVLAAMAGSSPIAVTQPLHGTAQLTSDGWVSYQPPVGFSGYDRFQYTIATADGRKSSAPVNVHVGDLDAVPGAFPEHPAATAFRPWQWPGLSGAMPWPRAAGAAQNQQGRTW